MTEPDRDDLRSRDDRHLREEVARARAWMQARGIEERAPDWEALAREERALWWGDRLREALAGLAARAGELPAAVAAALRGVGAMAEAALEVTLDAAGRVGRLLADPARACMPANVQFAHAAGVGVRRDPRDNESVGNFFVPGGLEAEVKADAQAGTVTVEFWSVREPPVVVLVPEDPTQPVRAVPAVVAEKGVPVARFEQVPPGAYLVSVYRGRERPT